MAYHAKNLLGTIHAVSTSDTSTARRGRPRVLDRGAVAAETYRLWVERGYDAVSWRDIAEATGVSVRTLNRHFASKSEIAWVGVPAATRRLRTALREMPAERPIHDAIRQAIAASLSDMLATSTGRNWVDAICTQAELAGSAWSAYLPWIDELARFLVERVPEMGSPAARAIANGYQATTFAALVSWKNGELPGTADAAVDEVLQWLTVSPLNQYPSTALRD